MTNFASTINGLDLFLFVWAVFATVMAFVGYFKVSDWRTLALDAASKIEAAMDSSRVWEHRWNREWRKHAEKERARACAPTTEPGRALARRRAPVRVPAASLWGSWCGPRRSCANWRRALRAGGWLTCAGRRPDGLALLEPLCPTCSVVMVDWLHVEAARHGATDEGREALASMRQSAVEGLTETRERLADLEHEQWAHWTKYMLGVLEPLIDFAQKVYDAGVDEEDVGAANLALDRWQRQIETPYEALTESEKNSDRTWADKVIALMAAGPVG